MSQDESGLPPFEPHFEPPAAPQAEDDCPKIVVKCQSCDGAGMLPANVQNGSQPPAVTLILCPHCKGQKTVVVGLRDVKWRIVLPEDSPSGARPLCEVTYAGDLKAGAPMSPEESGHVARTANTKNGVYVGLLYAYSEVARLRRELEEAKAAFAEESARLARELKEARVDIGAATLELRRAAAGLRRGEA